MCREVWRGVDEKPYAVEYCSPFTKRWIRHTEAETLPRAKIYVQLLLRTGMLRPEEVRVMDLRGEE